jgi:hypothetical protein
VVSKTYDGFETDDEIETYSEFETHNEFSIECSLPPDLGCATAARETL